MLFARATLLPVIVCLLTACSSGSSPTGPSPSPTGPSAPAPGPLSLPANPTNLRFSELNLPDRTVVFEWNGSANTAGYTIKWLTAEGEREIETEANTTRVTLTNLVTDTNGTVLVTAKNEAGTGATGSPPFYIPEFRDVVESLFFDTGPYGESGPTSVYYGGRMGGWAPGSDVAVRVDREIDGQALDNVTRFVQQLGELTSGYVHAHITEVGDVPEDGRFTAGEARVIQTDDFSTLCPSIPNALGCAPWAVLPGSPFLTVSGMAVVKPAQPPMVVIHELGHLLLGLHHVQVAAVWRVGPSIQIPRVTMGEGPGFIPSEQTLSPIELEALRRVYGSGLRPGATRADFYSRGLIRNP